MFFFLKKGFFFGLNILLLYAKLVNTTKTDARYSIKRLHVVSHSLTVTNSVANEANFVVSRSSITDFFFLKKEELLGKCLAAIELLKLRKTFFFSCCCFFLKKDRTNRM